MTARQREKSEVLRARVEPELVQAVEQLRVGNGLSSQGEMVRLLVRRGIRAVAQESDKPLREPLSREEYAQRAAGFMEALSDLISRVESHDREGAALLTAAVSTACWEWQSDRLSRTELLAEALQRVADVVDGEEDAKQRGDLWRTAMSHVKENAKRDYEKTTGKKVSKA